MATPPPTGRHSHLVRLFSLRTLWAALIAALLSLIVSALGSMLFFLAHHYNHAVLVVWNLNFEFVGTRGALFGCLLGWQAHSRRSAALVWGVGVVGATVCDWAFQFTRYIRWPQMVDPALVFHYAVNLGVIAALTYRIISHLGRQEVTTSLPERPLSAQTLEGAN